MIVFAFDRDLTVDSSPDPGPVPLALVRLLAEDPNNEVWAIGNQLLKGEAGILGRDEIRERLGIPPKNIAKRNEEKALGPQLTGKQRNVRSKIKYLKLLRRIFPDTGRICVDDFDLGEAEGWEYYAPQKFVDSFGQE